MNMVGLTGRLTRDPELRYTQGGTAICNMNVAVDRGLSKEKKLEAQANGQPVADFINVVVWGKMGETAANYLIKGRLVGITGRIQTGSYDHKDGYKVYTTDVVASNVDFLEWGEKKDNQGFIGTSGFQPVDNGDIPF